MLDGTNDRVPRQGAETKCAVRGTTTRVHPMSIRVVGVFAASGLVALTACAGGGVTDGGPPTTPDGPPPPSGVVTRARLEVRLEVVGEDAALAAQAGLTVPGTTVRLQRLASGDPERRAVVGASGVAPFDSLLEGTYVVGVERPLTDAEAARLPPAQREPTVFSGSLQVAVRPPTAASAVVPLVATRRGSVIISEVFAYSPGPPVFYGFGHYLEVFNNADTTAFLDGMLVFMTSGVQHTDVWGACARTAPVRLDDGWAWAHVIHAFPGRGRDYPIAPGAAKVVAMDAMDHRAASPGTQQVDLSRADFEQIGSEADINNPFVPDMVRVRAAAGALGRGYPLNSPRTIGLALPSAVTRLKDTVFLQDAGTGSVNLAGIPASALLDVVSLTYTPVVRARLAAAGLTSQDCDPWIALGMDRAAALLLDSAQPLAMARKSLGRTATGGELLQRTRTSARDFEVARPLRRSLAP